MEETQDQKLARLKKERDELMRAAEKAAHAYFVECEVGAERIAASDIYDNLRNAGRVY